MTNIDQLKQLREETQTSLQECRKALDETRGDLAKAKELLRKWGQALADKKSGREAKEGIIEAYIHPDKKTGVLLQLSCESDFVARSADFQHLAHELCLQIAATNPLFVAESEIPGEDAAKEKEILAAQADSLKKDPKILEQILAGKWQKRKQEICLLEQPWIKDDARKIRDLVTAAIAKLGENIVVKRFSRFSLR